MENVLKIIPITSAGITGFVYEKETKRIFLSDSGNSIWILQIENNVKFI